MAGPESKTNSIEKSKSTFPNTKEGIIKGKWKVGDFYGSIGSHCGWIVDKELFESIAHIETVYGTQDAGNGACKGIMQINPVIMSSDIIARPRYYGIVVKKWLIDEWNSNPDTVALLCKALGFSLQGKKLSQITSYLRTNIKDPTVNMCFSALLLRVFSVDKKVMSRSLPNLKNYIAVTKQTLKNKGIKVEDAKLNDLITRIQKKEQPLEQQYRILWRYNTGPAYGLKVLYCKLYT
jgi:hypothetical protein